MAQCTLEKRVLIQWQRQPELALATGVFQVHRGGDFVGTPFAGRFGRLDGGQARGRSTLWGSFDDWVVGRVRDGAGGYLAIAVPSFFGRLPRLFRGGAFFGATGFR